jgi:cobalt-zinc-cadmium efflux system outer membrane protein
MASTALPFRVACCVLGLAGVATAQERVLTPASVLDLVSRQNPEVLLARTRAAQAQGTLTTAEAILQTNPEADIFLGSRRPVTGSRSAEPEFSLLQRFEIGGQRSHRMAAATAGLAQGLAEVEAATVQAQAAALSALYRAAHAEKARRLADEAVTLAEEAARAAKGRYEVGETAVLAVNVARVELARARREQLAAASQVEGTLGELREVLGLSAQEPVRVDTRLDVPPVPPIDVLLSTLAERPDLRALRANLTQAEAEVKLRRAVRVPDLVAGFGFRREAGEPIAGVRLGFSIPLFQRQGGAIAAGEARVSESRIAAEVRQRALDARLRIAYRRYELALRAADDIVTTVVPLTKENEELTRESYQAGKIGLVELLVIRRESFAARREAVDAQLDAALAAVEVRAVAGRMQ